MLTMIICLTCVCLFELSACELVLNKHKSVYQEENEPPFVVGDSYQSVAV